MIFRTCVRAKSIEELLQMRDILENDDFHANQKQTTASEVEQIKNEYKDKHHVTNNKITINLYLCEIQCIVLLTNLTIVLLN